MNNSGYGSLNGFDVTQAELALLATVINQPELLDELAIGYEDFSETDGGLIYRAVQWLYEQGKPVSTVTVIERLAKRVSKDKLLTACNVSYAQPWAVHELARMVKESASRRRMLRVGQRLIELSQTAERMDDEVLSEAEKAFAEIGASDMRDGPVLIGDFMPEYMDELEYRYKHRGELIGIDTGFRELNFFFGGWRPTDLCIIGARPSMGKTAFALQTAIRGASDHIVVVFSIEMGKFSLVDRLVASESDVPLYNVRNGRIGDDHWSRLSTAVSTLADRNLYVDDNPRITIPYIRSRLRKIARKKPADKKMVVFLDYLQLVKVKGRSRAEEIGEVSSELKAIAKELNCCVVALAQLSRGVDQRSDKRPTLSDIRESGQIEQDADVVGFLYRDEYYNPETSAKNIVEFIVGKNRNGPTGTAQIVFLKEFQKFIDLDRPHANEE